MAGLQLTLGGLLDRGILGEMLGGGSSVELVSHQSKRFQYKLRKLEEDPATGPDCISVKFLKHIANVISLPIAILSHRIFSEPRWPEKWRLHHVISIFKKGSVYQPGQYRGVHLTTIISKTVEKVIGQPLTKFLEQHGYGDAQWAL